MDDKVITIGFVLIRFRVTHSTLDKDMHGSSSRECAKCSCKTKNPS